MKRVLVIGIGAGNPDYVTIEAINALNQADVIFVLDKGPQKADLTRLRREICERYIINRSPRLVEVPSPLRESSPLYYEATVQAWHEAKAEIFKTLIRDEIMEGECGALLVWGDPSLYDSTLRTLQQVAATGSPPFDYDVIPGVSSLHVLAARHRITLNTIGEPILITTGRKLAQGLPLGVDTIVVLLDGGPGLEAIKNEDLHIYWGAYLGTPDEILISGRVCDVVDDIKRIRRDSKAAKGWIMDAFLLRRNGSKG